MVASWKITFPSSSPSNSKISTHLFSNDSSDMIIVKATWPSRTGFASKGYGSKLQPGCPSTEQWSWKRRANDRNDSLLNGGNLNLINSFDTKFSFFSSPDRSGTTVPFEINYINVLFAFAIFVSGVHLISQSCCVCQNSYYPRQCPMYMGVLSSKLYMLLCINHENFLSIFDLLHSGEGVQMVD